jgi:Domain of unknown function (DUF1906)
MGGVVLTAGLGLALAGGGAASSGTTKASAFNGFAFDTCNAPKPFDLSAWLASPYRALGIYIGGVNRACDNSQLSPDWTASAISTGFGLIPIYVGLQAPCVGQGGVAKITPNIATSQGTAAADDAVTDSTALALPAGSPLYFDMEGYSLNNPACTQAVQAFVVGWVNELHALGYLAGVYGSAASTMRDLQPLATTGSSPDDVWIADWNGDKGVFGDPYVSDAYWTNHQRLHQYSGGHQETWGGVTLDVDSDFVDGAVVGTAGSPPLPVAPALTPTVSESAAGSVTSVDGDSSVSWPAGAFQRPTVVTLTPVLPTQPVPGFSGGGYGVQLSVLQSASAMLRTGFSVPLTIHIAPRRGELAPMTSTDGATWKPLQALFSGALPKGARAGYSRNPDGSVDIETTAGGFFALLPESSRPPAPTGLTGRFDHGALVLSWAKSLAASGPAISYRVTLGTHPLLSTPGQTTAALTSIHHDAPSVYRVIATDAAGKVSETSKPLVVLPSKRPPKLPKAIPHWAFALFDWQQNGKTGPRPAAPRIAPAWYWRWYDWHAAPFHIRS